ncbi:MAG: energy transducer TonB [Polyangiaceae bacterium]
MLESVREPSSTLSAHVVVRSHAEQAAAKRARARRRIHARALHPIDVPHLVRDPLLRRRSPLASLLATLRLLAAALGLHLFAVIVLVAAGRLMPQRPRFTSAPPLSVRVVELPPLDRDPAALVPAEPEAAEPAVPEPPRPEPPKPPRPPPRAKEAAPAPAAASDPPATNEPQPASNAEPIPLIGLSLESTVSGTGPAFVTGTSRMGETPVEQKASGAPSSGPAATASGAAGSAPVGTQRVATAIPSRDEKLEKPRRLQLKEPAYPATLRAQGIEGEVLVTVSIDARGVVQQAAVLRGSGHAEFDAAALSAARAERFAPAARDGTPVPFTLSYTYRFRIED